LFEPETIKEVRHSKTDRGEIVKDGAFCSICGEYIPFLVLGWNYDFTKKTFICCDCEYKERLTKPLR
jgi:hypothetical protein